MSPSKAQFIERQRAGSTSEFPKDSIGCHRVNNSLGIYKQQNLSRLETDRPEGPSGSEHCAHRSLICRLLWEERPSRLSIAHASLWLEGSCTLVLKYFHNEGLWCGQLGVDVPSLGPLVRSPKRQGCSRTWPLINSPVFYFIRTTLESDGAEGA